MQIKVKDHPASLGMTCDQHVNYPSRCWLYRPELPQIHQHFANYLLFYCGFQGSRLELHEHEVGLYGVSNRSPHTRAYRWKIEMRNT